MNGPSGPYKEALQVLMESWIKQYSELQKTLFERKSLAAKACAYVKGYAAKQFASSRTVQQLIEQTKEGFYGDGGKHEGSINNIKNAKDWEGIDEKEDEDEDDDINIEPDNNIE
ncbi:unnamed protein product [Didymodactylos carnosus]|uniref:Uncharacterized protein n=1 Tax=Didymodactylos carnosus TaxID=1234261 RepID=A0A8S2EGK9_9BILA|nr:unnamed protein product [Didymodactylos carnosus]CAF3981134.1 unnamed protein product [Didymodactylos carnosus]